ncbi:MAG: type IV pilin, partial [Thermoplasmata archaeon]|nr:type IV pilin [Thermoplasmata archaeon]
MTKIGNIRKWVKDKAGVSPIIAIILMVAITVVLAA